MHKNTLDISAVFDNVPGIHSFFSFMQNAIGLKSAEIYVSPFTTTTKIGIAFPSFLLVNRTIIGTKRAGRRIYQMIAEYKRIE